MMIWKTVEIVGGVPVIEYMVADTLAPPEVKTPELIDDIDEFQCQWRVWCIMTTGTDNDDAVFDRRKDAEDAAKGYMEMVREYLKDNPNYVFIFDCGTAIRLADILYFIALPEGEPK